MFIYVHTNRINGKKYVGQTHNIEERWAFNGARYKKQMFGRAIEKYGWDNFSHHYLEVPDEDADAVEQLLIDYWNTTNPNNGYNLALGGVVPTGPEVWKKISDSLKGREFSEEHRKHISESKKGQGLGIKNPKRGHPGATNPTAKSVRCVETGRLFTTIKEAEAWVGSKGIGNVIHGRRERCGGYHWELE